MGVFLGVVPDEVALADLALHPRPERDGVRWEPAERLHVTLRYTAAVHEELIEQLDVVTREVARRGPAPTITLGPTTELLGRDGTLVVPATGADDLASLVDEVLDDQGIAEVLGHREHPFFGHMTLARRRRRSVIPLDLVGVPLTTTFRPAALHLIVSEPGPDGSVYDHRIRSPFV